jgi:hypothetical protein
MVILIIKYTIQGIYMNRDRNFLITLIVCTVICVGILIALMYSFVQVLVAGF